MAAKLLTMPGTLNQPNPSFAGQPIYGNTNFLLSVLGPAGSAQAAHSLLSLYAVDSNSYSTTPAVAGYGWVHLDQISYLLCQCQPGRQGRGCRRRLPSAPKPGLSAHSPSQHKTWVEGNNPIVGQYHEGVCSPEIDTGLLAQYIQSGDVKAVTVGHDHTNDFCTATPVEGSVTLCYDGHGSYGASGYGEEDWPIRARV